MAINAVVIAASLFMLFTDWRQTVAIFRRSDLNESNTAIVWAFMRWGDRGVARYFQAAALLVVAVWSADVFVSVPDWYGPARIIATILWWFQQVGWIASNKELLK